MDMFRRPLYPHVLLQGNEIVPTQSSQPAGPSIRVYAPGSIGNMGPGLDILGLATTGAGDIVELRRSNDPRLRIRDPGHPDLPTDPARNAATLAIEAVGRRAARPLPGLEVSVEKGLPLAGGQGGSAASAVAAAKAINILLGDPLTDSELVGAAMEAEAVLAGRHADNVAPSTLGGLVLIPSVDPLEVIRIPTPEALRVVLVHPAYTMRTEAGRALLPASVPREDAIAQAGRVAGIVSGCYRGDLDLIGRSLVDRIAEPARAPHLPGFRAAQEAALHAGALGCSISGSGPTVFALTSVAGPSGTILRAMVDAYRGLGIEVTARVAEVDRIGARVL